MTDRLLKVLMDGTPIGSLTMSAQGALSFTYDDDYLNLPHPTPLSLSMPLRSKPYGNRVTLPFFQGLLPDNPLALEAIARKHQVSANSPFALLEHMGHDVAGALQIIRPSDISEDATANRAKMTVVDDEQLTNMLRETLATYDDGAMPGHAQRMSLAGAQAKLGVARTSDGRWAIPERDVPTTHIFKPQLANSSTFPDSDIVELFCQRVVANAGLPAAHAAVWQSPDGSVRAIVSERYDRRQRKDGTYDRLHQEDLCQALSVMPQKKYQRQDGGPGIRQISQLFATRLSPQNLTDVSTNFLKALTANAALLNTDAHAKNYSLMLSGETVRLAPLYDVLSIGAFLDSDAHPLSPMRLGKTFDLEQVYPQTLAQEGKRLGIPTPDAEAIVEETTRQLSSALDETAESLAPLDRNGIITRTVETIRSHSRLV